MVRIARRIARTIAEPVSNSKYLSVSGGAPAPTRGPELGFYTTDGQWTTGANAATLFQDASGIHFLNANNLAAMAHTVAGLEDLATYEVTYTLANYVGGQEKPILYGATTAHAKAGTPHGVNGTYTEQVTLDGAGSFANQIRFQATGVSGTNTYDIVGFVSIKKVLA